MAAHRAPLSASPALPRWRVPEVPRPSVPQEWQSAQRPSARSDRPAVAEFGTLDSAAGLPLGMHTAIVLSAAPRHPEVALVIHDRA